MKTPTVGSSGGLFFGALGAVSRVTYKGYLSNSRRIRFPHFSLHLKTAPPGYPLQFRSCHHRHCGLRAAIPRTGVFSRAHFPAEFLLLSLARRGWRRSLMRAKYVACPSYHGVPVSRKNKNPRGPKHRVSILPLPSPVIPICPSPFSAPSATHFSPKHKNRKKILRNLPCIS
jgi:hypothetical protein